MAENITADEMVIDAPLEQYQKIYKDAHNQNVEAFIDNLIEKSQVNIDENRSTVKKIRKKEAERDHLSKKISGKKTLRLFLIFLIIAAIGVIIYSITELQAYGYDILHVVLIPFMTVISGLFIFLIWKKINVQLKALKKSKQEVITVLKELMDLAHKQMLPLNQLFYEGMSKEIFSKTIPLIKLDKMFDSKRLDYMIEKFGLSNIYNKNRSALYIQSGEIKGNPFYIADELVHHMGTKSYSGSIVIHWTTTSTVNGKRVTRHHSQTLTATVNKPYPMYQEQPYLVYANDAAPDLIFSRTDSDAEHLTQKQIDKKVDKDIKKLSKKSEKSITKGGSYTVMGNQEFEVLFNATNRNNEVQFRLLFTPLAQKQLLQLMKEKTIGFGDDFDFVKDKKINKIYPEQLSQIKLNVSPDYFMGYDIDAIRKHFVDYNNRYFKHIFFTFAPVLAIPLYQQTVPQEYIYKDLYPSYVSFYEHEKVVNMMNESEFKHPLSITRNILKTKTLTSGESKDTVAVTAYGYKGENRIDYITKLGGDGRMHTIPVSWVEYLPVDNTSVVEIQVIEDEVEQTPQDRIRAIFERLKNKEIDQKDLFVVSSFVAHVIKDKKI